MVLLELETIQLLWFTKFSQVNSFPIMMAEMPSHVIW